MFPTDLFSSLPTDTQTAEQAYAAYWAIATSEVGAVAVSTSPIYRFARENMCRAIMRDHELTFAQVQWLYDNVLPEGPGWGSLTRMIAYGRQEMFGLVRMSENIENCLSHSEGIHSLDCPFRN